MPYWIHYSFNLWQPAEARHTLDEALARAREVVNRWEATVGVKHTARIYYGPTLVCEVGQNEQ